MITRRKFLASSVAISCPFLTKLHAQPVTKPARILVGFPAGGSIDTVARLFAEHLQGFATSLIVDNRPGAGGRQALDALRLSEADGSVVAITPGDQLALFPHVYNRLSYKPLEDFIPVTPVCSVQFLLTVGPLVPTEVKTLADFTAWCRANPAKAIYGTAGAGTRPHFLGMSLAKAAGFEFVHLPYKGNPPAIQDMIGGHVAANIGTIGNTLAQVQSGVLRALATSAPARSASLPDVPTFRELGYPALEGVELFGFLLPAKTPDNTVAALHAAIHQALAKSQVKAGLGRLSLDPTETSPRDYAQLISDDARRWEKIVRTSGFKPLE